MSNGFDRLARPYRWLEYLSFGRALERCRFRFLPELGAARNVLLLGDGDGRFAARLLLRAPGARLHAADASTGMLLALQQRCAAAVPGSCVTTYATDLNRQFPAGLEKQVFDVVATHFLLDCLSEQHIQALAERLKPQLAPDACWIVSEFNIPAGVLRLPARVLVRGLYLAFRLLTGLEIQHLPDYQAALQRAGYRCVRSVPSLGGLLLSQMWVPAAEPSSNRRGLESKMR